MSPDREQLIRRSWTALQPQSSAIAERFYARLLATDPHARELFAATEMEVQRQKFLDMLGEIVAVLDDPARLVGEVAASGQRHAGYGVEDRDYDRVGAALLWAMREQLGADFDAELEDAWRELYGLVAAVMRRGAARAGRPG